MIINWANNYLDYELLFKYNFTLAYIKIKQFIILLKYIYFINKNMNIDTNMSTSTNINQDEDEDEDASINKNISMNGDVPSESSYFFKQDKNNKPKAKILKLLAWIIGFIGFIGIVFFILYFSPIQFKYKPVLKSMQIFPTYTKTVLFYPTLEIPVMFIWIGPNPLPHKYVERLKKLNFPYKLLGEEQFNQFKSFFNFSEDIKTGKRSDAFRLAYLEKYGGLYADLDYVIDYQCLMMKLQGLKGTYFAQELNQWREPSISLIYASEPGDPILRQVISKAHERQSQTTLHFLNVYMLRKYEFQLKSIDLDQCAYHQFDAMWFQKGKGSNT